MAFDFFSQPQGPKIDISLFPDAVSKGINQGNAQQTTGQAIASGVVSGIKTGMDLYQEYQKIQDNELTLEVKRNAVEQIPVANKIQEATLLNQESVATINEAKARQAVALEADVTAAESAKAQKEAADAELGVQEARAKLEFSKLIKSTDPTTFRKNFQAGMYSSMVTDKETYQNVLDYASRDKSLTEQERAAFSTARRNNAIDIDAQKKAAANERDYLEQLGQLTSPNSAEGIITNTAADKLRMRPEDALGVMASYPAGTVQVKNGRMVTQADGTPVFTTAIVPPTSKDKVDVFSTDPRTKGLLLYPNAPDSFNTLMLKYSGSKRLQDGTYAKYAKETIDRSQKEAQATAQSQEQGAPTNTQAVKPITFSDVITAKVLQFIVMFIYHVYFMLFCVYTIHYED
jgi:hypothetical protein